MFPSSVRLRVIMLPVLLAGFLQLSGCSLTGAKTAATPKPAPPGGVYRSTSAGATFDQSVMVADKPGEYIALFNLQRAEWPAFQPATVYIAAATQGIVKSADDGVTWTIIKTPLASTFDVTLLKNGILVASGSTKDGQGVVIRSADDGKSWETTLTVPVPATNNNFIFANDSNPSQSIIVSLAADPFHDDRVYAGTSLGTLLVGEQSAKTWRTLQTINDNNSQVGIKDIVVSPYQADEVLLLLADGSLMRINGNVQAAINIPKDLRPNTNNLLGGSGGHKRVYDISYVPQFPDALFAGVDDGAVISRDRGATWVQLPLPLDQQERFNSSAVAVSPTNSSRLLITINNVVYRSEDGGYTWYTLNMPLTTHIITDVLIDPQNAANVLLITRPVSS